MRAASGGRNCGVLDNRARFGDFLIEEIDLPLLVDGFEE